jgi:tartrate-resistant acid phosphatase type 5
VTWDPRPWGPPCAVLLCALAAGPSVGCSQAPTCNEASALGRAPSTASNPAPAGAVRLIVVGDVGEGNTAQLLVARAMAAKCAAVGGCDAVLMTGDNFYQNGVADVRDPQWVGKFEQPYDLPNLDVPFHVVLGNHDVRSTGWAAQIAYSSLPVGDHEGMRPSRRWHMPAQWYDVRLEHVHLFALDTNHPSHEQASDMAARVSASDAPWKIAFAHHPRYTSGAHALDPHDAEEERDLYPMQEAIFCGTDLFVAGHDHDVEFIDKGRHAACPRTHFAVSGAGSKVRASLAAREPHSLFFDDRVESFAYLQITRDELRFEFVDMCGSVSYGKTLTR